jgi:hypothetical protein
MSKMPQQLRPRRIVAAITSDLSWKSYNTLSPDMRQLRRLPFEQIHAALWNKLAPAFDELQNGLTGANVVTQQKAPPITVNSTIQKHEVDHCYGDRFSLIGHVLTSNFWVLHRDCNQQHVSPYYKIHQSKMTEAELTGLTELLDNELDNQLYGLDGALRLV